MAEQKPSILVVDDDKDDLDKVGKALEPIHLEIDTLQDPHRVMQVVESTAPHLLILDALLPGLSGFDLCKQIKTTAATKKTTVLILTGVYLKDRYRREAIHQFKADGFATKPFRDRELQRLVLRLLADKLKMSPSQLQDRLLHSGEIFVSEEKEDRPGILGRIFGRLRSTPEPSVSEGFLHTAPSSKDSATAVPEDESEEDVAPEPSTATPSTEAAERPTDAAEGETRPDMSQVEPGGDDTLQAETSSETVHVGVEPKEEPDRAQAETNEEESVATAASPGAELETARTEETPEIPEPEPVKQLDGEANATLAEIVQSELNIVAGADQLPEGTPVESSDASHAQSAEESVESDQALPAAPHTEPEEGVQAEGGSTKEVGSDLEAAKAIFDALGPVPGASTGEFKLPEGEEKEPENQTPPPESVQESEVVAAESVAREKDDAAREEHHVVREEEDEESLKLHDQVPAEVAPDAVGEALPIYPEEAFLHELRREVMMCRRVDRPLTLILIRIADLGQIVELFGKDFRPKVMRHVAIQALESLREVDIVGLLEAKELLALTAFASDRYGGERIVSRLQAALGRNPFQVGEGIPSFIPKLRFGIAAYPKEAANSEELLERAEDEVEPPASAT